MAEDSDSEDVYSWGYHSLTGACGTSSIDLYRRRDGTWDSLATLNGSVRELVVWRDTVFVCSNVIQSGDFDVYYYAGGDLLSYGDIGFGAGVRRLRVIEDTLWAVGTISLFDGEVICGVAKKTDSGWQPVGNMPDSDFQVTDIVKYQGELIASGNGYRVNDRFGIYHLVDGEWQVLGDALAGLTSWPLVMRVHQDILYIGGQIRMSEGNVGHGLIAWNGNEYLNVGGGLTWGLNDYYTLTGVLALEERDGLLYAGGGFFYAGDLPAQGLVTWDGTQWCDVQGDFMGPSGGYYISDMAFSGDSLYVACTGVVDDMEDVFAAAAAVADLPGECQDVAVQELEQAALLGISPNPAADRITLVADRPIAVAIRDAMGRAAWSMQAVSTTMIDLSSWAPGVYTVHHQGRAQKLLVVR